MKLTKVNNLFILILTTVLFGCNELELTSKKTVYLNTKIGNVSGGNAIKLFDIATDSRRSKVYVQSILSPQIAVIDANTDQLEKYIDSTISGYHLSYMAVQESTGHLFIADRSSKVLVKMDPASGKVMQTLDLTNIGTPAKIAFLESKNYVLVSFSSKNEVIAFKANTLERLHLGLNSNLGIHGPQGMKIRGDKIYVALSNDGGDYSNVNGELSNSAVAIIDSSDWSVQSISVPYKGALEVAVDQLNGRYFLLNNNRLSMKNSRGEWATKPSNGTEFQDLHYSKKLGLIVITRTGEDSEESEAPYGSIEIRDPETLEVNKSIALGMKSSRMALIGNLEKLYVTNMAQGTVSRINYDQLELGQLQQFKTKLLGKISTIRDSKKVKQIDVGTSIEAFKLHPNGKEAFLINRLGGSSLLHYDYSTDQVTEIKTRNWPSKIELSAEREEVYVFSHFASAVEIFDINSLELKGTIELTSYGMDQGRTDLIPSMTFNSATNKLYISLPEQGKITEVNVKRMKVTYTVSAFTPLKDSGEHESDNHVGTVQLAIDSISGRLFVFYRNTNQIEIRDTFDNMRKRKTIDVSDEVSEETDARFFNGELIRVDSTGRRFFIGPYIYEISGGDIEKKEKLKNVDSVVAWYDDYVIAADIDSDKNVTLKLFEKKSSTRYKKIMSDTVSDMITNAPKFEYSQEKERIFVSYMSRAKLKIYKVKEK